MQDVVGVACEIVQGAIEKRAIAKEMVAGIRAKLSPEEIAEGAAFFSGWQSRGTWETDSQVAPKLADLRGIAPNATGDKSATEFVADLRERSDKESNV